MSQNANNEASNPPWAEELTRLVERAQKGDQAVLPRLQTLLDAHPEVWEEHGELGRKTEGLLIHLITGKNLMAAVSLQRKLEAMRKELLEGSSSPVERLLVERIVATWLQTQFFDALCSQATDTNNPRVKLVQQQQDAAQRRYLEAVKMLAKPGSRVRRWGPVAGKVGVAS